MTTEQMGKQREDALVAYYRARERETHCRARADQMFAGVQRIAALYESGNLVCNTRGAFHGLKDDRAVSLPSHDEASTL